MPNICWRSHKLGNLNWESALEIDFCILSLQERVIAVHFQVRFLHFRSKMCQIHWECDTHIHLGWFTPNQIKNADKLPEDGQVLPMLAIKVCKSQFQGHSLNSDCQICDSFNKYLASVLVKTHLWMLFGSFKPPQSTWRWTPMTLSRVESMQKWISRALSLLRLPNLWLLHYKLGICTTQNSPWDVLWKFSTSSRYLKMDKYAPLLHWKYSQLNFKGTVSIQISQFVTPSLQIGHLYHWKPHLWMSFGSFEPPQSTWKWQTMALAWKESPLCRPFRTYNSLSFDLAT